MDKIMPDYGEWTLWEAYYKQLDTEFIQSMDEGKDIAGYEPLFSAVAAMPDCKEKDEMADVLFRIVRDAPQRDDFPFDEPDGIEDIIRLSERLPAPKAAPDLNRIRGAWYGRICGCLLGKPVEGIHRDELTLFLERTGNLPMRRYIVKSEAEKHGADLHFPIARRAYPDGVLGCAPDDDDTNYIMIAFRAVEKYGKEFTSRDMSKIWLGSQRKDAYCTAERVAYRNFVNGYLPPQSAQYKNPYREWIGAQIRGDFFGWINPGDPAAASEAAWRDARISHVKNGIYGEMWVAAMLAFAGAGADIPSAVKGGLSYVPKTCRLHKAISGVIGAYERGASEKEFFADFHKRWNDRVGHHWCHTLSNAEIVAAALLWGGGDYGRSVCLAVEQGFDTDCNGATVGSVAGMALGFDGIPDVWIAKINGRLQTGLFGSEVVNVDEMAEKTLKTIGKTEK